MSDNKRKIRKRKDGQENNEEKVPDKPTKEEKKIAKWMRQNIPIKKTKFLNHTVEYFTAYQAVDRLLESPWSQPSKSGADDALFTTRDSIVHYMDIMLRHKLFHRARKIVVPENELKSKKKKDKEAKEKEEKEKKEKEDKEKKEKEEKEKEKAKKAEKEQSEVAESSQPEGGDKQEKGKKKKKEEEKKKRKVRLDMHLEQRFVDGNDAYVWLYEPTPYYYYFFGFLVVIAVIAVCLFPLWPSSVRQGVYYLSLAAAGFLVFILALAVLRLVIFCIVWCITFGKHHLWLLPNLTEDVGFLQSFWPLYKYEYKGEVVNEEDDEDEEEENENEENGDSKSKDDVPLLGKKEDADNNRQSESEGSQPSQTDKDFEIVDKEEIES